MLTNSFTTRNGLVTETISWTVYEPATPYQSAVVIAYGSDGLTPQWSPEIVRHATELQSAGILALIPDYFQKSPAVNHGNSDVVFSQIVTRYDEWSQVLRDAVTAAKALPGITPSKVGFLGFSLGGYLGLRIRQEVNTLVEYFAPFRFPPQLDLGAETPLKGLGSSISSLGHQILIHHGKDDALVPWKLNADPIEAALKGEGASVTLSLHDGANHGFSGTDTYNQNARKKSLQETISFLKAKL